MTVDSQVVSWVSSQLIPPIGTPIASRIQSPVSSAFASNQTSINVDTLVAVLAGIGIIMGAVLDWTQGITANSFKIPAAFLVDTHTRSPNPRLGYFIVALGILGVLLAFVRNARIVRGLVGSAAFGIAVL